MTKHNDRNKIFFSLYFVNSGDKGLIAVLNTIFYELTTDLDKVNSNFCKQKLYRNVVTIKIFQLSDICPSVQTDGM